MSHYVPVLKTQLSFHSGLRLSFQTLFCLLPGSPVANMCTHTTAYSYLDDDLISELLYGFLMVNFHS